MLVLLDLDALVLRAARAGLPEAGVVVGERVRLEVGLHAVGERQPVDTVDGGAVHYGVRAQFVQGRHWKRDRE